MTDRDHFAAAALTGFASQPRFNCGSVLTLTAKQCYELADAMLRERARTNLDAAPAAIVPEPEPSAARRRPAGGTGDTDHGAAPAARASVGRPRTDNADLPTCAGTGDTPEIAAYRRFVDEVMNWISEATGFLHDDVLRTDDARDIITDACSRCWDAFDRIASPTVHGASPEARASVDSVAPQPTTRGESDRNDKAAPRPSEGTGDTPKPISGCVSDRPTPITGPDPDSRVWETPVHTPATHATHGEGSEQRECTEPVAWAVTMGDGSVYEAFAAHQHGEAVALAKRCMFGTAGPLPLAPLYRHPPCQDFSPKNLTLTDAEREAVETCIADDEAMTHHSRAATLRGLLRRLGGEG